MVLWKKSSRAYYGEGYADDEIIHCISLNQAQFLQQKFQERFAKFGLELNLRKTKVVYCKDEHIKGKHKNISFNFLGYIFRPRSARDRVRNSFASFLPAMSNRAKSYIRKEVREWELQRKTGFKLEDLVDMMNKKIQGWMDYYSRFCGSSLKQTLR